MRAFRLLAGARVRAELQYRASFASFVVAQAVVTSLDAVVILVFFQNVNDMGGWTRSEVLYLYAVSTVALGIADFLLGSIEYLPQHVRTGTLDRLLLRPVGVLAQLLAEEFALRRIGRIVQSSIVLVLAIATLDASWTVARVAVAIAGLAGAVLTFCALFVLTSSISFWSPNTQEFANAFTYGGATVGEFPTHVFPQWIRWFFIGVVPAGGAVYLPAVFALDAPNPMGVPQWAQVASPLVCVPVLLAAAGVWRLGLRRYESTGS